MATVSHLVNVVGWGGADLSDSYKGYGWMIQILWWVLEVGGAVEKEKEMDFHFGFLSFFEREIDDFNVPLSLSLSLSKNNWVVMDDLAPI
jgi:hypothetical protein